MANIREVKYENRDEISEIMDLIYNVFSTKNSKDSSQKLTKRYEVLFGPERVFKDTLKRFKQSDIFLLAIEANTIIWMIRWKNGKIINLYVDTKHEWQWIGWILVDQFEEASKAKWIKKILLKSSRYAKEFYLKKWFSERDGQYLEKNI